MDKKKDSTEFIVKYLADIGVFLPRICLRHISGVVIICLNNKI